MRKFVISAVLAALVPVIPAHASGPVTRTGYLAARDGARLRYTAVLPNDTGRFPVALIYSVYTDDVGPTGGYPPAESGVIAQASPGLQKSFATSLNDAMNKGLGLNRDDRIDRERRSHMPAPVPAVTAAPWFSSQSPLLTGGLIVAAVIGGLMVLKKVL